MQNAADMYSRLRKMLDDMNWQYSRLKRELGVRYFVSGEDIPMEFLVKIKPDVRMLCFISILPAKFNDSNRADAVLAACAANHGMVMGSFAYNMELDRVVFMASSLYDECETGTDWLKHQMYLSQTIVEQYNDRFLMLSKGVLSVEDFIADERREAGSGT